MTGQASDEEERKMCDIHRMNDMRASVTSPGDAMKVMGPSSSSTRVTHTSLSTLTYLRRMSHSEGQMYTALQSRHTGVNMGSRHMLGIVIQRYHLMFCSHRMVSSSVLVDNIHECVPTATLKMYSGVQ